MNAVGPLKLSNVSDNFADIVIFDPLDRRHITESPMMSTNPKFGGTMERNITVVAGLVKLVNQGWCDAILSSGVATMALRAVGVEKLLPLFCRFSQFRHGDIDHRGT